MKKIILQDLINLSDEEIKRSKIKFNKWNGYNDPLEIYKKNPEDINTNWLLWHNKSHYFSKNNYAICLVPLSYDTWLFTTIKEIDEVLDVTDDIGYKAHEIQKYEKYYGRVIIKYHKKSRSMGFWYENIMNDLEVLELLNDQYTGDEFPGYDSVRLSFSQLENIIMRKIPGWYNALNNQKAVYLQVDKKTGKMYVGSATAQYGMLLQRWSEYVYNGHGGNVDLKELVKEKGFDYIKNNFMYIILENYNSKVDDNYILSREKWWKETLMSKKYGYNKN